ncbi:MAG: YhdP family protein, partial [Plesiomonas sp.]
ILGGINLSQAAQAWRYYPRGLMGNALTDYLTPTLKAGQVQGATLVWAGDPLQFPYQGNEGVFQVAVPVRQAVFQFDPNWLPLRDLDLDLLFEDDRLLMRSTQARLGAARATRIDARIDPLREDASLKIDASVQGRAPEVQYYLTHSPLRDSVGAALQEIQLQGPVKGDLQLSIPLSGAEADAKGRVWLENNTLRLTSLDLVLSGVKGAFRFDNGNLRSQPLQARLWQQPLTLNFTTRQQKKNYAIDVDLNGDWAVNQLHQVWPTPLWQQLSGRLPWQGKVAVQLPDKGGARYQINVDGALGAVRSRLPAPLDSPAWQGQRWQATAKGDLKRFTVQGNWGALARFQGQWLVGKQATLQRAWLDLGAASHLARPAGAMVLTANVPTLDLDAWQGMLAPAVDNLSRSTPTPAHWLRYLPDYLQLDTKALQLAGQRWDNLSLNGRLQGDSYQLKVVAKQIRGSAALYRQAPWRIDLAYLNWQHPLSSVGESATPTVNTLASESFDFRRWPALRLRCNDCRIDGQSLKLVQADLTPSAQALTLSNGLIDTGVGTLTLDGAWRGGRGQPVITTVGGRLQTPNLAVLLTHFGVATSLRDTPTDLTYTLRWPGAPWQLALEQLGGSLSLKARKGMVSDVGGRAGQVLRLVSTDSLLRKLRLDFSDAFEEGFFYDKITGTASISRGILRTDNLLIDGLLADIAMRGELNLYRRTLNMDAVIAPELGAGLSVATAFVVNPVAGLALFAASQALSPLWSKISLLRYHIEGSMDNPLVQETQRIEKGDF